jgi:predicted metal-binding membrane protein
MVRIVFSLGATTVQRALVAVLLVSPIMEITKPAVGATLLFVAGLYQLTPLKRLPTEVPVTPWIPIERLAHWILRDVHYGPRARCVLRGLLLP